MFPRLSTLKIAAASALFSLFIEFFKFYHTPALDNFRDTTMGRLIFGYGFSWSNIACYLLGILFGIGVEASLARISRNTHAVIVTSSQ
jgi:glycopeptide antibiotics resistance protein